MPADDFEIVPQKDFLQMKRDVDELKTNPLGATQSGKDLKSSIDNLNSTMKEMLDLFSTALETIKIDEHDKRLVEEKITPLVAKIDELSNQNEKIAKALVAIADMVKDMKPVPQSQNMQNPSQNFQPQMDFGQMPPMNNVPQNNMPLPRGFEPFPGGMNSPQMPEKKKLFGFK